MPDAVGSDPITVRSTVRGVRVRTSNRAVAHGRGGGYCGAAKRNICPCLGNTRPGAATGRRAGRVVPDKSWLLSASVAGLSELQLRRCLGPGSGFSREALLNSAQQRSSKASRPSARFTAGSAPRQSSTAEEDRLGSRRVKASCAGRPSLSERDESERDEAASVRADSSCVTTRK